MAGERAEKWGRCPGGIEMERILLTSAWVEVAAGVDSVLVQATGGSALLYIGTIAPAGGTDVGIRLDGKGEDGGSFFSQNFTGMTLWARAAPAFKETYLTSAAW